MTTSKFSVCNRALAVGHQNRRYLFAAGVVGLALSLAMLPNLIFAANGTWNQTSGGTWNDAVTGPWTGGVVAGGAGFTADFSTQNITADQVITLDASRVIGTMLFGDATTASNNWTLANSG